MLKIQPKILSVLFLVLTIANELFAIGHLAKLEETPLGFYEKYCPQQRLQLGGRLDAQSAPLPQKYYVQGITPAKDQGPLGTCASFAVGACVERYHSVPLSEAALTVSKAEFTVLAETHLPEGNCIPGLSLGNALRLAQQSGFIEETRLPYNAYLASVARMNNVYDLNRLNQDSIQICRRHDTVSNQDNYNHSMQALGFNIRLSGNTNMDVTPYRVRQLDVLHHVSVSALQQSLSGQSITRARNSVGRPTKADIESVKRALYRDRPVAAALPIFDTCWNVTAQSPVIQMPRRNAPYKGSHAVVLTGYSDAQQSFVVKNSWGQTWGKDGFAGIPYKYVRTYATELIAV